MSRIRTAQTNFTAGENRPAAGRPRRPDRLRQRAGTLTNVFVLPTAA